MLGLWTNSPQTDSHKVPKFQTLFLFLHIFTEAYNPVICISTEMQ